MGFKVLKNTNTLQEILVGIMVPRGLSPPNNNDNGACIRALPHGVLHPVFVCGVGYGVLLSNLPVEASIYPGVKNLSVKTQFR